MMPAMNVTYTPPLMEQIKGNHKRVEMEKARPVIVYVRAAGVYVMEVNPNTYQCTDRPQQFIRRPDDGMTILPPYQWVEHPDVLDFIADCVMAGMARSGSVYELKLPTELLERAFQNTVELLKAQVVVVD